MQSITFLEKYFGNLNDINNINYNLLLEKKEKNSLYIKATINKHFLKKHMKPNLNYQN